MNSVDFATFFQGQARRFLLRSIDLALEEDGNDLTSAGLFDAAAFMEATIVAKEECVAVGLPLAALILSRCEAAFFPKMPYTVELLQNEGALVAQGKILLRIRGQAALLLKSERIILNFLTHLCGIANLTRRYAAAMEGSKTRLLDTRKTLPCLRYPEKYAVLLGGGCNHRMNLEDMLMLKDNHIDRAGSIGKAVAQLRGLYSPCPPIEVECRNEDEVRQAVAAGVERIMLDNMAPDQIRHVLPAIPKGIETEISGGVDLDNIRDYAALGADFISVGRVTHSAPSADLSMRVTPLSTVPQCGQNNIQAMTETEHASIIRSSREKLGSNLTIMAHHYEGDGVVEQADLVGDSLELARKIDGISSRYIVFCGVYFMAESAAILADPQQEIYIPDLDARCVMSEMAPAQRVEEAVKRLNSGSKRVIPVAYVNTSAAVKAVCGRYGGTVCTSANAGKILSWALDNADAVLFLPDKNLAGNTADTLGVPADQRFMLDIRQNASNVLPEMAQKHKLLVWPGCCAVHHGFKVRQIEAARKAHPDALVVVHPECAPEVVQQADSAGSTSHIIRYVAAAPEGATIYVGTEVNLVRRLGNQYREKKTVLPLAELACSNMAKVTPAKLGAMLQGLAQGRSPLSPVRVAPDIAEPAHKALERMLKVSS